MVEEYSYIAFPLPLIRRFFTDPAKAAGDIIDYGIYFASTKLAIEDDTNALRQVIYNFIQQGQRVSMDENCSIPPELATRLVALKDKEGFTAHIDYNGFDPEEDFDKFNVSDDIALLHDLPNNDKGLYDDIIEWYRLRQVQEVVGVDFLATEHRQISGTYHHIQNQFGESKQIPVSCKTSIMLNKCDNPGTERERAKLCLYLGIRSLIGKAVIAATTQKAVIWRMFGCRNDEELNEILEDNRLSAVFEKWCTRRQLNNLFDELRNDKLVNKITFDRQTYLTCALQDDNEFCEEIIRSRKKTSFAAARQELRERDKKMRERLKTLSLYGTDTLNIPFGEIMDG